MKRSYMDAMICKQEGITEITRDEIHRIQLEKLNIVLKSVKERSRFRAVPVVTGVSVELLPEPVFSCPL